MLEQKTPLMHFEEQDFEDFTLYGGGLMFPEPYTGGTL